MAEIFSGNTQSFQSVHFMDAVVKPFLQVQNIILENIAKSEKFCARDIIVTFDESCNTNISLAGGTLGAHAIYIILENIVRNAAKHNKNTDNIIVEVSISNVNGKKTCIITDKTSPSQNITDAMIDALNTDVTLDTHKFRGIKEIRVCSAFLRDGNIFSVNEKTLSIPDSEYLVYSFVFPVYYQMLIVTDRSLEIADSQYAVVTAQEYIDSDISKNHKLTIIDKTLSKETKKELIAKSPARLIEYNLQNIKLVEYRLFIKLYKEWINTICKTVKDNLKVDDCYLAIEDKHFDGIEDYTEIRKTRITNALQGKYPKQNVILFRTHNDTENEFKEFRGGNDKVHFKNSLFIEGISGHNSTDRLIRHEELNEEWRLKLIESSLLKITIVDERIFDNFKSEGIENKIEAKELIKHTDTIDNVRKYLKDHFGELDENVKDKVEKLRRIIEEENDYPLKEFKRLIKKHTNNISTYLNNLDSKTIVDVLYKKNIQIYNIINKDLEIINLQNQNTETIPKSNFVCVHQGILEKMKDDDENLQETFERFKKMFPIFSEGRYIVHSGGLKSSELYNKIPFISFSNLQHALNDCKYSLVQLAMQA